MPCPFFYGVEVNIDKVRYKMNKHIVIIGAGYAGMMAALRLSHTTRHRKDVNVTLINGRAVFTERIRSHQWAANRVPKQYRIEHMLRGTGVKFVQGLVTSLDANAQQISVQKDAGAEAIRYDMLVYALGSSTNLDAIPGVEQYAYTLDAQSAESAREKLPQIAANGGRCVVIGGGLTGIEIATELAEVYPKLQISLLTRGELGSDLSQSAQDYLHNTFADMKIDLIENVPVTEIAQEVICVEDKEVIPYDIVFWTGGFSIPQLAQQAGIFVNSYGQVLIDENMRSVSHSNIYATGDSASFISQTGMQGLRLSCQVAMPMGTHVGDNLAAVIKGEPEKPFAFGYGMQCISLGSKRSLIQFTKGDDSPTKQIATGRTGMFIKNLVLDYTVWSLKMERLLPMYNYPKARKAHPTSVLERRVWEG